MTSASPESLKRKHEAREPRLVAPVIMAVSVVAIIILSLLGAGFFMYLQSQHRSLHQMQSLGLVSAPDQTPLTRFPPPNLQLDDGHADSTALAAQQEAKLNSYGWVDRNHGIVHIPIQRAIDLILAEGLPVRPLFTNETGSLILKKETP